MNQESMSMSFRNYFVSYYVPVIFRIRGASSQTLTQFSAMKNGCPPIFRIKFLKNVILNNFFAWTIFRNKIVRNRNNVLFRGASSQTLTEFSTVRMDVNNKFSKKDYFESIVFAWTIFRNQFVRNQSNLIIRGACSQTLTQFVTIRIDVFPFFETNFRKTLFRILFFCLDNFSKPFFLKSKQSYNLWGLFTNVN